MTQYDDKVQQTRDRIAAEAWASTVKSIHAHSLSSIWYDNRPQDTVDEDGNPRSVMDVEYNDGTIKRTLDNGEVVILGKRLSGQELVDSYYKSKA